MIWSLTSRMQDEDFKNEERGKITKEIKTIYDVNGKYISLLGATHVRHHLTSKKLFHTE